MARVATPFGRRALALALCLSFCVLLVPTAAASVREMGADSPADVRAYWTLDRMEAAEPALPPEPAIASAPSASEPSERASGTATAVEPVEARTERASYKRTEVADPAGESVRMHGKVFFTITGGTAPGNYVCSGTALNSNNRSVVWTAGHCVYDTFGGGYASNWLFVPGYSAEGAPFGEWPAEALAAPSEWRGQENSSYDFSAARVAKNAQGQKLTDVVGGRGIGFNQARNQRYTSYGYPAQPPPLEFSGDREFKCESALGGTDNPPGSGPNTNWIGCDMTGGSSGGGWIANGTLLSVNSYSYCIVGALCQQRMYGPYLDDTAKRLYKEIAGAAEYCQDKKVTISGTGGADKLVGTSGRDVISAKGGKDVVKGKGGKDIICGGGGADTLKGGGGKDRLNGEGGDDTLKGGKGKDTCNGGKGKDRGKSCESSKNIP